MNRRPAVFAAWVLAGAGLAGGAQPTKLPAALASAEANAWVKLDETHLEGRRSAGLVFLPGEGRFLCIGGIAPMKSSYSEMTLDLAAGRWENRFPKGKEGVWGPPVGRHKAPGFHRHSTFQDDAGNFRPNLACGYLHHMYVFDNHAYDPRRGRIVVAWHKLNRTVEYAVATGTWHPVPTADETPLEFWDAMLWGSACHDPVNREVLAGHGRWAYAQGRWRKLSFGSQWLNGVRGEAEALHRRLRALAGACRARYYLAEDPVEAGRRLDKQADQIVTEAKVLAEDLRRGASGRPEHEKTQAARARAALKEASGGLAGAVPALAGAMQPKTIHAIDAAADALERAAEALAVAPSGRAFSPMAYDAGNRVIVLFGGDALDRFLGDTWVYHCADRRWEQRRPDPSPSPRAGHALLYLPQAGKLLLVDGYGIGPRGQMWTYDTAGDRWELLAETDPKRPPLTARPHYGKMPNAAAAGPGDVVVALDAAGATWAARIDAKRTDAARRKELGGPAGHGPRGGGSSHPQWYEKNAPAPDPAAQERWLSRLPANRWMQKPQAPNCPDVNRAWGTSVLDARRQQILQWGGGHAAWCGNNVLHYSIRADRYYVGYAPEFELNFDGGMGGVPISQSYSRRPLMTGHAYHAYAYDAVSARLVVCGQMQHGLPHKFFLYDPAGADWAARPILTPFRTRYESTFCIPTDKGVVAWHGQQLWRADVAGMKWRKLPLEGKLPPQRPDWHGMTWDPQRDRLLLFFWRSNGNVTAYDIKTGKAGPLNPAGMAAAVAPAREMVYLPEADKVLLAARPSIDVDDKPRWLLYDCAANAWQAVHLGGAEPLARQKGRAPFGLGLMYDRDRKLLWGMTSRGRVHVLRLDLTAADVVELKGAAPPAGGKG